MATLSTFSCNSKSAEEAPAEKPSGSYTIVSCASKPEDGVQPKEESPRETVVYDFTQGNIPDSLFYCYSIHNATFQKLHPGKGCIVNSEFNGSIDSGGYVGLQTTRRFKKGCEVTMECEFEGLGAPLFVMSDDFFDLEGQMRYGRRFEVVAYKDGFNVWDVKVPNKQVKEVAVRKLAYAQFPVADSQHIVLKVKVTDYGLETDMNGKVVGVSCDELPETFSVGVMACEGVCRLYKMTVTQ